VKNTSIFYDDSHKLLRASGYYIIFSYILLYILQIKGGSASKLEVVAT
jgi:hypothetical protein